MLFRLARRFQLTELLGEASNFWVWEPRPSILVDDLVRLLGGADDAIFRGQFRSLIVDLLGNFLRLCLCLTPLATKTLPFKLFHHSHDSS